ncbi:MAG: hypothetical protein K2H85_10730 [Allobaculum sp.]|nr:hypothetical protein [Allobaculum sp.]
MIIGQNTSISENVILPDDVVIGNNVCIQDNVEIGVGCRICDGSIVCADSKIGAHSYLDYGTILRENVTLGENAFIGARCILGEYLVDFMENRDFQRHKTVIGDHALIRSETIIYGENVIGHHLQTGHRTTIRENSRIGHHVRLGTLCDIQGDCQIGNYVSMQSGIYIAQRSIIKVYVWLFPHVVLTNDPNPPSEELQGITIEEFASVAARSVILPGKVIGKDSLVGAGSVVNRDVPEGKIVVGNPIREIGDAVNFKSKTTGESVYPWRYHFDRGMPWKGVGYDEWAALQDD